MVCPPVSLCVREAGTSSMARLTTQVRRIWAKLHAIHQSEDSSVLQPLHHVCGGPYRLAKMPADPTLERVKTGFPHPPRRIRI